MATLVQSHDRECVVCTNDFKTPKILPCGHLLCRECVITWMDSKSHAGCPLCTCPIVEHQGNSSQSSADVVDALPTDSVMEAIVETARLLMKDDFCTVCDDVKSEYICMQCLEKMCQSCMKIHKKMVVSRSHDVESLSTVTPERLAASRPALCADHGDKQAEMFCANHRLVICTSCSSSKHIDCPDVKYLDVLVTAAGTALDSSTEKLVKAEDNLNQRIRNLNVRIQKAVSTKQENMALVDETCDRLQKMVEESRKQLKTLISDSISKFKKSLNHVKKELEKRLGKVTSHKHLVTRATTVRPRPALIPAAQTLTDRVHNLNFSDDLEAEPWVDPSPEIVKYCDDVGKLMEAELQSLELHRTEAEASVLVFHENGGHNIRLTNDRTTARMADRSLTGNSMVVSRDAMAVNVLYEASVLVFHENGGHNIRLTNDRTTARMADRSLTGNSMVVSRDAMAVNVLYEVRLGETDDRNYISLGVNRNSSTDVKSLYDQGSIMISSSEVSYKGNLLQSIIGKALSSIKVGSRVGLLVDSSNDLHLYVDGHDQGVAAKKVWQPCFAVFDFNVIQVTALPTSRRT